MGSSDCDQGDTRPLSITEVATHFSCDVAGFLCAAAKCYPLSNAWPMGHSWSSAISQYVMTNTCLEAGLSSEAFLCEASGLPILYGNSVSVATDHVALFERGGRHCTQPGSTAPF